MGSIGESVLVRGGDLDIARTLVRVRRIVLLVIRLVERPELKVISTAESFDPDPGDFEVLSLGHYFANLFGAFIVLLAIMYPALARCFTEAPSI